MDSDCFDRLARTVSTADTRRGVLQLLSALPLAGALTVLLAEESPAGRRKRRTDRPRQEQNTRGNQRNRTQNQLEQERKKPKKRHKKRKTKGKNTDTSTRPTPCISTTCTAQGKNCGTIADGCGGQLRCGPDACGDGFSCTENVCRCADGTAVCDGTCCQDGEQCRNGTGACCTAQGQADACAGRACGTAIDSCTGAEYACAPLGETCVERGYTCSDAGACQCPASRETCPPGGASATCCAAGAVCKDGDGPCCTPTTCAAQNQTCGTLPDNCGTTLTCTGCTGCCSGESCVTVCPAGQSCSGGVCTDSVVTFECPGPLQAFFGAGQPATTRFAQTFTAAQSGSLLRIQLQVVKDADSTGDYVVDLLAASGGGPTNTVLATATISNASVPVGASTLTASFSGPPLVAGTKYAAAISRPGGNQLGPGNRPGSPCPGSAFSQTPTGTGAFEEFTTQGGIDLVTTVTVLP